MEKLTLDDICKWILTNKDNQEVMDIISNLAFPYSSKYKSYYRRG